MVIITCWNFAHAPCDPSSGSKSCTQFSLGGLCGIAPGPCADVISFGTPYGDPRVFAGELLVIKGGVCLTLLSWLMVEFQYYDIRGLTYILHQIKTVQKSNQVAIQVLFFRCTSLSLAGYGQDDGEQPWYDSYAPSKSVFLRMLQAINFLCGTKSQLAPEVSAFSSPPSLSSEPKALAKARLFHQAESGMLLIALYLVTP